MRNIFWRLIYFSGVNDLYMLFDRRPRLDLICYHSVQKDKPLPGAEKITVSAGDLERQIAYLLRRDYRFITFNQIGEGQAGEKVAAVYFDDGFYDNLAIALPILQKYKVAATIFPAMDFIGRKNYLSWNDLGKLRDAGWAIGSHGITHKIFKDLSETELANELTESKKILEEQLGIKVSALSYPHSVSDAKIEAAVLTAGYKWAVTIAGVNFSKRLNPSALRKVAVGNQGALWRLKLKLGIMPIMHKIIYGDKR
jgi:peptidoglycan/xylan/chitin deacetylase (PgdA/CDA1 family)